MNVHTIAMAGGLFSIFAFVHFFTDWLFQNHSEAMQKHNKFWLRTKHCAIYTIGFLPLFYILHFSFWEWIAGINILFWSHHIEDTYFPVYLWAKYIRRPPEMSCPLTHTNIDGYKTVLPPNPKAGFIKFIDTTLGKILMIVVDQIIHLTFLFPLVYFALN